MQKKPDPVKIRTQAEAYYRDMDYYCSEAIVKVINDEFGLGYPDSVIKMASGFPIGMGGSGCTCGAVAGGIMALGMVFGRTRAKDEQVRQCMALSRELHDRFRETHGCLCCRILTKDTVLGSPVHMQQCIAFTGEVAEETAKIILRELDTPAGPDKKTRV
ncbi:C-GCAxxG-C-C family protein [Methanoregula sp.]|uniref:C-GCAxxG-C-C family protein n=1 Tax=Methanoregula sp. TaxID=2052170 RepID=UPI003C780295